MHQLGDRPQEVLRNLDEAIGESGAASQAIALLRETLAGLPELAKGSEVSLKLRHNLGHFLMVTEAFDEAETIFVEGGC